MSTEYTHFSLISPPLQTQGEQALCNISSDISKVVAYSESQSLFYVFHARCHCLHSSSCTGKTKKKKKLWGRGRQCLMLRFFFCFLNV